MNLRAFHALLLSSLIFLPPYVEAQVPVVPDSLPEHWIEEVADTSGSQDIVSLVFKTIPGVEYFVQTSEDLSEWQTLEDRHYGLGQDVVLPMLAKSHVAGSGGGESGGDPPQPVAPTINVSLFMRRASGGGIVLGWISLDTGTAIQYHLASAEAVPEWN